MRDLVLRLRNLRSASGMTQKELAALAGIHQKTLSSFESGDRISRIRVADLDQIAAALGYTLIEFLQYEPSELPEPRVAIAPSVTQARVVVDPLAPYRRESSYPTPQSSLGGCVL